jgi:tetratricopeptide (TPR) repeat protein
MRPRWWWLTLLSGLLLVAGGGWYGWRWITAPEPPQVSLANADPAVVEVIEAALARVRRNPHSGDDWGALGQVLLTHGYAPEATRCFIQAEALDDQNPRWPYYQGLIILLTDPEAALPYLRRTVALCDANDRGTKAPRLQLADTLLQLGQRAEAEQLYLSVRHTDPDDPRVHFGLGVLAAGRNEFDVAIDHLARAARSPTARQKAFAQLAMVYQRMGNTVAADEFNQRAAQAPKDHAWNDPYVLEYQKLEVGKLSRFRQAEQLNAQGRTEEVSLMLRQMANEYADDRSHVALGMTLAKMGDLDGAEAALRTAVQQAPDNIHAHYSLCEVLFFQGETLWKQGDSERERACEKYRACAASAQRALELKPDHAFALYYRGLALKKLGQTAAAVECLRQAVRCRPEVGDLHLQLGEALAEAGQVEEARKVLRQAVSLAAKDDARARQALERLP